MKTPDKIGYAVNNLEKDLSDGLRLICLIECLSGKKLPRHSTSPVFRSQKLENVSVALNFLENEGIKLVSIGKAIDCSIMFTLYTNQKLSGLDFD